MRDCLQSSRAVERLLEGAFSDALTTNSVRVHPDMLAASEYYLPKQVLAGILQHITAGEDRIGAGSDSESISLQTVLADFARSQAVAPTSSRGFVANLQRRRALARFALLLAGMDPSAPDRASDEVPDLTYRPVTLVAGTKIVELSSDG